MSHGGACAAGSELDHPIAGNVCQFTLEALGKAPPIGVAADAASVAEHDCVDRTERLGVGRQLIEQGNNSLLAGIGNVQAGEAHPPR